MSVTELIIGEDVFNLLNTQDFENQWKQLAALSQGFTLLQEPEFVSTWYKTYEKEYVPVFSAIFDNKKQLKALMCLAWDINNEAITHAGHHNAEYHGWLAIPNLE